MSSKSQSKHPPETLTLEEIGERYPERWILLSVTEFSERHEPVAGQVAADSDKHWVVWNKLAKLDRQQGGIASGSYYVFQAFPPLPAGTTWHDILEEAARRGPPRGVQW